MSGSGKSEQEHVRYFLHKTWKPGSFWTFHVVVMQSNVKEMYKKACCMQLDPLLYLTVLVAFAA